MHLIALKLPSSRLLAIHYPDVVIGMYIWVFVFPSKLCAKNWLGCVLEPQNVENPQILTGELVLLLRSTVGG